MAMTDIIVISSAICNCHSQIQNLVIGKLICRFLIFYIYILLHLQLPLFSAKKSRPKFPFFPKLVKI